MRKNLLRIVSLGGFCVLFAGLMILILATACSDDNPTSSDLPQLLLSPATIADTSTEGVGDATFRLVKVDSDPRASVHFNFSCDAPWIDLSNLAGSNSGTTRDSFSVAYSVASLPVGTYVDSVMITSAECSNSPTYLEISYTILERLPQLRAWPPRFFNYVEDPADAVAPDTFRVTSTDGGAFDYTITEESDWISLSGTSGTTPDTIVITVDPNAVIWGGHVDTLWVYSDDLTNSPQYVVCSLYTHAWQPQHAPVPHILYDAEFIDDQRAWAVGTALGYMDGGWTGWGIYTDDGGETWTMDLELLILADEGEYFGLSSIAMSGSNLWTVGQNGIIRHSPDYGENWYSQSTGLADTAVHLYDVGFVSDQVGWIVGAGGLILTTEDGGDTWTEQTSGTSNDLRGCHFADVSNGWTVGDNGVALRTTNGGDSWAAMSIPYGDYKDVFFVDANNGWAVANGGVISYTSDGGLSWISQESGFAGWLHSVIFIDNSVGWVTGGAGTVLYTDNSGATWTPQTTGTDRDLYKAFFLDELRGWVFGQYGEIRYTNCGGN